MFVPNARGREDLQGIGRRVRRQLVLQPLAIDLAQSVRQSINEPHLAGRDEKLVEADLSPRIGNFDARASHESATRSAEIRRC